MPSYEAGRGKSCHVVSENTSDIREHSSLRPPPRAPSHVACKCDKRYVGKSEGSERSPSRTDLVTDLRPTTHSPFSWWSCRETGHRRHYLIIERRPENDTKIGLYCSLKSGPPEQQCLRNPRTEAVAQWYIRGPVLARIRSSSPEVLFAASSTLGTGSFVS